MEQLLKITKRVYNSRLFPLILFLIVGLLILSEQILQHSLVLGHDSIFHYNRFLDAEEQIRTGKFNYFQMNFSFNQTGRMVNALYGPLIAYLSGLLLLISANWYVFNIIDSLVVIMVAAFGMYCLCKVNKVSRSYSLLIAVMYMMGSSVITWVNTQQFTGFGAAVLPYLFIAVSLTLTRLKVPVIALAVAMAVIIQTHMITSLIGFVSLVPIFVVALYKTDDKVRLCLDSILAAGLTLALTANIWGVFISVFKANNLIPAFPSINMSLNAFIFDRYSYLMIIKPIELIVFLYVIGYVIIKWRSLDYIVKTYSVVGTFFLWLSTNLFPWHLIQEWVSALSTYLQFPKRFSVVPFILLFLVLGMILTHDPAALSLRRWSINSNGIRYASIFVVLSIMFTTNIWILRSQINLTQATMNTNQLHISVQHIVSHAKRNQRQFKDDFYSHDKTAMLQDIAKVVPDYLPANQKIDAKNYRQIHPYNLYYRQLDKANYAIKGGFTKQVNADGSLKVSWNNRAKKATDVLVPVVAYAASELTLNGKSYTPDEQTTVGAVVVKSAPGLNQLTLRYHVGWAIKFLFIITALSWLMVFGYLIYAHKSKKD